MAGLRCTRRGVPGLVCLLAAAVVGWGCAGPSTVTVKQGYPFKETMSIAVLDFDWIPPTGTVAFGQTVVHAPNAGKYVADGISGRLLEIPQFRIIERSRLARLLAEKDLSQSELIKQGRYQEIGQFLRVDYLVIGTVNTYSCWSNGTLSGHMVSFNCRCVEVESGQVVWTLEGKVDVGPFGPLDPAAGLARILDDAMPKLRAQIDAATRSAG
jgi:curli biogenesis system outer membrane secretion channel CsgG